MKRGDSNAKNYWEVVSGTKQPKLGGSGARWNSGIRVEFSEISTKKRVFFLQYHHVSDATQRVLSEAVASRGPSVPLDSR